MLAKLSNTQQILILLGVLIIGLVIGNVIPPINTWFASKPDNAGGQIPVLDENGKPTGRYAPASASSNTRAKGCCAWGGGFVGNGCRFPVTKDDKIPTCTLL